MLPPNVFRPSEVDWEDAWQGHDPPPGYSGRVLEIGQRLGLTALGATLVALPPGARACPLHFHHFEEELFFVVAGEVTVRELLPGAENYVEYPLRRGELAAYPPGTGVAHQSWNRGDSEVRYLALSDAWNDHEVAEYPDSGKVLVRGLGTVGVLDGGSEETLAAARCAAEARRIRSLALGERPSHVQGPLTLAERDLGGGVYGRPLARRAGARRVFANRDRLTAGAVSGPLHWHTSDEELLLVLEGTPTLRQLRDEVEERALLQPGDLVCWKPGDRVAHQLIAEEAGDAVVLVVGTARQDDVIVFPEEGRVFVRALGRRGALERTGYWAGEG